MFPQEFLACPCRKISSHQSFIYSFEYLTGARRKRNWNLGREQKPELHAQTNLQEDRITKPESCCIAAAVFLQLIYGISTVVASRMYMILCASEGASQWALSKCLRTIRSTNTQKLPPCIVMQWWPHQLHSSRALQCSSDDLLLLQTCIRFSVNPERIKLCTWGRV